MAMTSILNPASLLKASGLGAIAAALAMMAMPSDAFAQDREGRGGWRGGQSAQAGQAQAQSGGNDGRSWSGGRGVAQQQSGDSGRSWNGNRGIDRSARADDGNRRGRAESAPPRSSANQPNAARPNNGQAARNWSRSDQNGAAGQNWRNRAGTATQGTVDNSAGRAGQQQWSGRNRGYADPNRNTTYRQREAAQQRNWRGNDRHGNENWRGNDRRGNENWRGNNSGTNRWTNNNNGRWNRDWRRDNRYNWQGYRNSNRNVYRLGSYYSPYRNYSYRRLSAGFYLDSLFFGSRYWINDPWSYRLPAAYGNFRWIRYYDDALLVDVYSGEVVDVINDFFW